jgi:hypothetical protein
MNSSTAGDAYEKFAPKNCFLCGNIVPDALFTDFLMAKVVMVYIQHTYGLRRSRRPGKAIQPVVPVALHVNLDKISEPERETFTA